VKTSAVLPVLEVYLRIKSSTRRTTKIDRLIPSICDADGDMEQGDKTEVIGEKEKCAWKSPWLFASMSLCHRRLLAAIS